MWPQTVFKCRQRFVQSRLDGLADEPRPGAPRKISDEQIVAVLVDTLERQPADATQLHRPPVRMRMRPRSRRQAVPARWRITFDRECHYGGSSILTGQSA